MKRQRSMDEYYPRSKRVVFILQRGNHIVPVARRDFKREQERNRK